ncbi:MAG: glycosyltransferase [Oscillospiraceae bacterium]|nr:glycosyltransferase [Oscillospiraceae bacterium]
MKLSIIVPVYKVEEYLGECVDSLLSQTIDDYEIILVDDGSPDNSGKIADEYAAANPDMIRVLHIDNGGQGRARNFALDIAKGDFVGFVDSDDWVTHDMYEKMYTRAAETGADVVVCDFMERFADGRESMLPASLQDNWLGSAGSSCNKIFRRSLVGALRFPVGLWYEDFYFSAVMLLRSKHTEFIAEPLYIYRRGQESTMHNNNAAKNLDMLTIMDMLEKEMVPAGYKDDFEFFLVNHVLLDSISRLAKQDAPERKEVIGKLRQYVQAKIPKLSGCGSYKKESRKRRLIMWMNYHGLEDAGQFILKINQTLHGI